MANMAEHARGTAVRMRRQDAAMKKLMEAKNAKLARQKAQKTLFFHIPPAHVILPDMKHKEPEFAGKPADGAVGQTSVQESAAAEMV